MSSQPLLQLPPLPNHRYFQTKKLEDIWIGKDAKGVIVFAIVPIRSHGFEGPFAPHNWRDAFLGLPQMTLTDAIWHPSRCQFPLEITFMRVALAASIPHFHPHFSSSEETEFNAPLPVFHFRTTTVTLNLPPTSLVHFRTITIRERRKQPSVGRTYLI